AIARARGSHGRASCTRARAPGDQGRGVRGTVYLVGAGPGDPRLLTLRGAEVLREADAVVYDRLVSGELLDLAPSRAARVDGGKEPGRPHHDQVEINRLIVDLALAGKDVVRLKGGDPFVFG